MRPTPARRITVAAAAALVLALGACSSSGSTGVPGNEQPAPSGTSGKAGMARTSVAASTTPVSDTASTAPTSAATGIPLAAHRVSAAAYQVGTDDDHGTAHAMPGVVQFTTPSGNIACTVSSGSDPTVYCSITAHDFPLPARPSSCTLNWAGGLLTLDDHAAVLGHCVGGQDVTAHSRTLAYGDVLNTRGISCYSGSAALTCTDHGHGFALSRAAAHTY